MLLSSEPFCVHELFGLPDHIDQAGAAQGAGAGADVAPPRSPTRLESNVTAKAGGVADLKTCDQHDEFKKRVQQAVPEIRELATTIASESANAGARTGTLKNRPRIPPMSTCRSAVPLRKGELLLQGRQLTARLLRQAEAAEIDAPAP